MATLLVCVIFKFPVYSCQSDLALDLQNYSTLYHTGRHILGPQRYPQPPTIFSAPGCAYYHRW